MWSPSISMFLQSPANTNIYLCFKFHEYLFKNEKVIAKKTIFSTKTNQAWPVIAQAYRYSNGLKFALISTYISGFIKIGRKMDRLLSEKAIFWLKPVRRDSWSLMHVSISMYLSVGWYLPIFQVSSKLAENDQVIIAKRIFSTKISQV